MNEKHWLVLVVDLCWTYRCNADIVWLRARTTDDTLHIAGAAFLACFWHCEHVVVAAAFLN